jgi:putative oligomerization/nucleic acid binding protein
MGAACPLLAAAPAGKFSFLDPSVLIPTLALAGALLVMAVIIAQVQRWRKRQDSETFTTHDQMASFRVLYERGELSQEEYDRIRQRLLVQIRKGKAGQPALPPVRKEPPAAVRRPEADEPGTSTPGPATPGPDSH